MAASPLCCCEYYDKAGERRHLLECCCNCTELDYCFERLISCKRIRLRHLKKVMTAVGERTLLIPWFGGAKSCSFYLAAPVLLLPLFLVAAAQGVWMSVVTFSFLPIFLVYIHFILMKFYSSTPFFFAWNIMTFSTILIIFEFIGVRLLEIRTDENVAFILLTSIVLFCIYKVKEKEKLSVIINEYEGDMEVSLLCSDCNIKVPPRSVHCYSCQACISLRDQHCAWFNCCIGEKNHHWYMAFLTTSFAQLLFCSNLILTTACHPMRFIGSIMLPDDCTEVYFDSLYALCFVTSLYCLEASVFVLAVILLEVWLISLGVTGDEFRSRSRRALLCGLSSPRPHSKGLIQNWINYIKVGSRRIRLGGQGMLSGAGLTPQPKSNLCIQAGGRPPDDEQSGAGRGQGELRSALDRQWFVLQVESASPHQLLCTLFFPTPIRLFCFTILCKTVMIMDVEELLIENVRDHMVLYNPSEKMYMDNNCKTQM